MSLPDPWRRLRAATPARIGQGRSGDAPTTADLLDFQRACAEARDAVHAPLDGAALAAALAPLAVTEVRSAARDRAEYLRRPDLGRQLAEPDRLGPGGCDLAFVIADGLSAGAVAAQAAATVRACIERLPDRISAIVAVHQGRVAIGDEIAERLGARFVVVLIGERPGLSVPESLGAYLTFEPRIGRRDSERNCVSNIHAHGLSPAEAADRIAWLVREGEAIGATGVALKDRSGGPPRLEG
jgi:ethanolamine ammonia-lyase small subunit